MSYIPKNNLVRTGLVPDLDMSNYSQEKLNEYIQQIRTSASNVISDVVVAYTHGFGTSLPILAYFGGVYSPTQNRIYMIPFGISNVADWHYIDCSNGNVVAYTHGFGTALSFTAYTFGVYSPTQNRIYMNPNGISNVADWHYIDCSNGNVVAYTHGFGTALPSSVYFSGVYSPTQNRIYMIPYGISNQANWHYIDCDNGNVVAYTHGFGTTLSFTAYLGGVYSPTQNRIYMIPNSISDVADWHYIQTFSDITPSKKLMANGMFNKL